MRTDLYEHHVALGAKMVDFSGWLMPIQYRGIIEEHQAVREKVGVFDVSHMGRIRIEGPDAERLLDWLSTNKISGLKDGSAVYTVWCREDGSAVDDLIVYRTDATHFFVIVNASNRQRDLHHLRQEAAAFDVRIEDCFDTEGILALQGPEASSYFPHIKPFHFETRKDMIVAATGYTGSPGVEIYAPKPVIRALWETYISEGVAPIGLGARDTLRLEMGYALYGHELSDTVAPVESVSAWTVKMDKPDFLGKAALGRYTRHQYGIVLEKGIAREGFSVFQGEKLIGIITSGTMSPTLKKGIAIMMVNHRCKAGDRVEVDIRGKRVGAEVVNIPFVNKKKAEK